MNEEIVAQIIAMADGGCSNCVGELVRHMEEEFPEFPWKERTDFYMHHEDKESLPHQRHEPCSPSRTSAPLPEGDRG